MNRFAVVLVLLAGATASFAQDDVTRFASTTERASTRFLYWNNERNQAEGELAINYGRPAWKEEYGAQLDDMTKGKLWRMGNDFWSQLDTNLPVRIGGQRILEGYYYLAVGRSADGETWNLVLLSPEATREKKVDAFETTTRPDDLPAGRRAPLQFERTTGPPTGKLTIDLVPDEANPKKGSLRIAWGHFALSAPVEVEIGS